MTRNMFLRAKEEKKLSAKSKKIIELVTQGLTVDEVMMDDPTITEADIIAAARDALLLRETAPSYTEFRARILKEFPRAYLPWTQAEDRRIYEMYEEGRTLREIAAATERHPNAIRSRLHWLKVPPRERK